MSDFPDAGLLREYRKKPVTIRAIRFTADNADVVAANLDMLLKPKEWGYVQDEAGKGRFQVFNTEENAWLEIPEGHWIIAGVNGEVYPCSDDVFAKTYEVPTYPSTAGRNDPKIREALKERDKERGPRNEGGGDRPVTVVDPNGPRGGQNQAPGRGGRS